MREADNDFAHVMSALHRSGIDIPDVNALFLKSFDIRKATPVLFALLDSIRSDEARDAIIRAFARREVRGLVAKRMVEEFRKAHRTIHVDARRNAVAWSVGNTLEQVADDSIASDLIDIALDKDYGTSRQMICLGMGRLKDPRVVDVLISLLSDEDVQGHAVMALGKLGSQKAESHIQRFQEHPKSWIRKAAQRSLQRIHKQSRQK